MKYTSLYIALGLLYSSPIAAQNIYLRSVDIPEISLSTAGVPVDGVTNGALALVSAETAAIAGHYKLIAKPGDIVKIDQPITLSAAGIMDLTGAKLDCTPLASTANATCITVQGDSSQYGVIAKPGYFRGLTILGPRSTSSTMSCLKVQGTATNQIQNLQFDETTIYGCYKNLYFGDYVYLVTFNNLYNVASVYHGIDIDFSPTAGTFNATGENIRFVGGVCSNARNAGNAICAYIDAGNVNDVHFQDMSFDYSDNPFVLYSGSVDLSGHLESDTNTPYISIVGNGTNAGSMGPPTLYLNDPLFYQPLSAATAAGGTAETAGGRPLIISMAGFRARVVGRATWTKRTGDANGNPNTLFVNVPTGGQHIDVKVLGQEKIQSVNKLSGLGGAADAVLDFEDGSNSWIGALPSGYTIDTTNGKTAAKCLRIAESSATTPTTFYKDFSVRQSGLVRVRGWMKYISYTSGTLGLRYQELDANGNILVDGPITTGSSGAYITPTTSYTQMGDWVDVVKNAVTFRLIPYETGTMDACFDDIEVKTY